MKSVLVVEDELIIRKGLIRQVPWTEYGCVVKGEASNGREGIHQIETLRPQIVITDVRMPVMDGLEMIRLTKERYPYRAIVISGYSDYEYVRKALSLSVADYLLKPVDLTQLGCLLRRNVAQLEETERNIPLAVLAATWIREHINDVPTPKQVAETFAVSEDHLSRLVKREYGVTLHEYTTRARLNYAAELLSSSPGMKVYEAGEAAGYPDYKYFHAVFTRYFGVSPTDYRKNAETKKL